MIFTVYIDEKEKAFYSVSYNTGKEIYCDNLTNFYGEVLNVKRYIINTSKDLQKIPEKYKSVYKALFKNGFRKI